jgi:hypothetical protein
VFRFLGRIGDEVLRGGNAVLIHNFHADIFFYFGEKELVEKRVSRFQPVQKIQIPTNSLTMDIQISDSSHGRGGNAGDSPAAEEGGCRRRDHDG